MNLKNKTVLITGGNSGLGFEIAKELVKKQSKVIILGKDKQKVEKAKKLLSSHLVSTIACDLRDQKQIESVTKKIKDIDVLINCAGVIAYRSLDKHDVQNIKDIIDTNLLGAIFITRAVFPMMKKKNKGTIVNIVSTSGLMTGGHPDESVYMASKFAVSGFTEGLKKEVNALKKNIRVLGFYPGGMQTELFAKSGMDKNTSSFMPPAEVAKIIVFMLERPDSIKMDHIVVNRNKNLA